MSDVTFEIRKAIYNARENLAKVKRESRSIGSLASDPFVLKNMSGGDLAKIKKQLKNFNSKTWEWKE